MKTPTKQIVISLLIALLSMGSVSAYDRMAAQTQKASLITKAEDHFVNCRYKAALPIYVKLLKMDQHEPGINFKAGMCCFNIPGKNEEAIYYLKMACKSKDTLADALFYLGTIYQIEERFDEAIQTFQQFLNFIKSNKNGRELRGEVTLRMSMCHSAGSLLKKNISVDLKNFKELNSQYDDCAANMNKVSNMLYFSSKRKGNRGGFMDEDGSYPDDIYTFIVDNAMVGKAKKGPAKLNTIYADRVLSFSPDGQSMLISREGDIYISELKKKLWTVPVKMNSNINTKSIENTASFSDDGSVIYFSSNRKGGFGGMDLYKSEKNADGEWGNAINLGKTINSKYDEDYPFYHANSDILYFSSKREECIGGFDVFKSQREISGWKSPENMGAPLNTTADEIFFSIDDEGSHGFYSSSRKGGAGNLDVYELFFPNPSNDTAELSKNE